MLVDVISPKLKHWFTSIVQHSCLHAHIRQSLFSSSYMVTTMLAINNNSKTTMTMQFATTMGVEDMIAHHVH